MSEVDSTVLIRVHYPCNENRIVLRTDNDWNQDILPGTPQSSSNVTEFRIQCDQSFFYFKPVLMNGSQESWSRGENYLTTAADTRVREIFPHFCEYEKCSVCELQTIESTVAREDRAFRVFLPPGYYENTIRRYPVLYMQDGQNIFFPNEAFGREHWAISETLSLLDAMCAIGSVIVVAIYPRQREHDYTAPGYRAYGKFVAEQLKPHIDAAYRTIPGRGDTAIIGSSLGGVVSMHIAWEYPEVFGMVACMSSTFGWKDDLFRRISEDPHRNLRIYLDSGWPGDNYEVTRNMRDLLVRNGYESGSELLYFSFPNAVHNERAWAMRVHLPFQFFFG